ncbi:MAG: TonB-dependent receptor plug domain-containing protein [Actinomycetota bacterium]
MYGEDHRARNLLPPTPRRRHILAAALLYLVEWPHALAQPGSESDLTELRIEELMEQKVTSVSRTEQTFSDTAAATFVITQDDLRRSGVTNIAEALRIIPGVQVARIDSNKWAISARGFNGRFANKLLVLIDGRTIYTPSFSGRSRILSWNTSNASKLSAVPAPALGAPMRSTASLTSFTKRAGIPRVGLFR